MRLSAIISAFSLGSLLAGCQSIPEESSRIEQHFGEAVREAVAKQTLNPNASANTAAVTGMDGVTARATVKTYQETFTKTEEVPNVFTLGVRAKGKDEN